MKTFKPIFGMLLACSALMPVFTSCGEDDEKEDVPSVPDRPQFQKMTCTFTATASQDFLEAADVTMVVEGQLTRQPLKFGSKGKVTSNLTTNILPATYTVTFLVERKQPIQPVEGKDYNFIVDLASKIQMYDAEGNVIEGAELDTEKSVLHMEGVDMTLQDELFNTYLLGGSSPFFPATYTFKAELSDKGYVVYEQTAK